MLIEITGEHEKMLKLLAELQRISPTEALNRAIALDAMVKREIKHGNRVYILQPDETLKELRVSLNPWSLMED